MIRSIALFALFLAAGGSQANDVAQQIEEIVVTGAVRSNEAIEIAAIDLPGDTELVELPIISQ